MLSENPAAPGPPGVAAVGAVPPAAGASAPLSVLLVEDDDDLSEMYGFALRLRGHVVRVVANGLDVEPEAILQPPDVIVLDVELPGMNGLAVLEVLRASPATNRTPVLMLSNCSVLATASRALELGAAGYAVKVETTPARLADMLIGLTRPLPTIAADFTISPLTDGWTGTARGGKRD